MKSKSGMLDWRPWLFLFGILIGPFWLQICYYYEDGRVHGIAHATENYRIISGLVDWQSLDNHAWAWSILLAISAILMLWLLWRCVDSYFNSRSINSAEDRLLLRIPVCTDQVIVRLNSELGIMITPEEAQIPQEILRTASLEALAKDIGCLLYLNYADMEDLVKRDRYTAMHSLADLLLSSWSVDKMENFVDELGQVKDYLGEALDAALRRRTLERQVEELKSQIEACRQKEQEVVRLSGVRDKLSSDLEHYQELKTGRSALAKLISQLLRRIRRKLLGVS